jgi:hypothetical protein
MSTNYLDICFLLIKQLITAYSNHCSNDAEITFYNQINIIKENLTNPEKIIAVLYFENALRELNLDITGIVSKFQTNLLKD